jgi:hypothetical protein
MKTNLIGICGRMGAGKDYVGKIIQYLTLDNRVFSMNNEDIIADLKYNGYCAKQSNWQIKKYAYKLKQIVSILTGISVEDLEKEEVKNSFLPNEWGYYEFTGDLEPITMLAINDFKKMTVRQLLQNVGTDAMRDVIHPDIWVNALFSEYKESKPPKGDTFDYIHLKCIDCGKQFSGYKRQFICNDCYNTHNWYPNWIITDCRFYNEVEAIKNRGGIMIKVIKSDAPKKENEHISETALDDYTPDYVIEAKTGDINALIEQTKEILIKENII